MCNFMTADGCSFLFIELKLEIKPTNISAYLIILDIAAFICVKSKFAAIHDSCYFFSVLNGLVFDALAANYQLLLVGLHIKKLT